VLVLLLKASPFNIGPSHLDEAIASWHRRPPQKMLCYLISPRLRKPFAFFFIPLTAVSPTVQLSQSISIFSLRLHDFACT
jgi:hypothetical protein